ncbi:hypothetical protein [uncultured Jatrophihabitans sp.]|uniref:hypothetical protein n=1 Tax=uncultured Jatrophihabitans sp. TaxID=1610747 RepID=UPI0035CA592F
MNSARAVRNVCASVLTASALVLSACASSTGNASVSQQQVESRLKKDSEITQVKTSVGAAKYDTFVSCVAKALKKDATGSDLDDYVNNKKSLDDISGNAKAAKTDAQNCAKAAVSK